MRKYLLAATMLTALASGANAVVVNATDIGASGTTTLQGRVGPNATSVSGLTGTLFLRLDRLEDGGTTWVFDYTVTNTSGGNTTSSSIGSFGLDTSPNLADADSTGLYNLALLNPSFSNVGGANSIEVCFSAGNNSCNGNGNTLPIGSQPVSGEIELTFSTALMSISLDAAYLRFQDVGAISPSLSGSSGVGFNVGDVVITPQAVPGPALGAGLPALLAGLFGLFGFNRLRHRRSMA